MGPPTILTQELDCFFKISRMKVYRVFVILIVFTTLGFTCSNDTDEEIRESIEKIESDLNPDPTSVTGSDCNGQYAGPTNIDFQVRSFCETAFIYKCGGDEAGKKASCDTYKQYQQQFSNIPDCPYCN